MTILPEDRLARLEGSGSPLARPLLAALSVAAGGYGAAVAARGWLYRTGLWRAERLGRPVISVGNIEAGGTGKTPLVIWLAALLQRAGLRPAIISRGYKGAASGAVNVVSDGARVLLPASEAGDEPHLMARLLPGVPVLTGRRRSEPARAALERFGAQVVLLDDGFQHLSLARDLDLVVLGESFRPGARLLPRGLLREPLSALSRAHALVVASQGAREAARLLSQHFPGKACLAARHEPVGLREVSGGRKALCRELAGRPVVGFCAIGAPERFRRTLERLGAQVVGFHAFPDHHRFRPQELEALGVLAAGTGAWLVTTEKDAVRLEGIMQEGLALPAQVWALGVRLVVDDEEALERLVLQATAA